MVDGTTILIFEKPHYYGESFYDRKSRYSINVQIVSTPNRQIIDYATGFNGSRHDTHCFPFTRLAQDHTQLLSEGEWCWSDVGYPLQKWLMIPYKMPLAFSPLTIYGLVQSARCIICSLVIAIHENLLQSHVVLTVFV